MEPRQNELKLTNFLKFDSPLMSFYRSVLADLNLIALTDASWINLDDSVQPLLWQWGNNMNYNYSQWLPNQEPSLNTTNRCVSAANFDGSGTYWHRESCNTVLPIICQTRPLQMSSNLFYSN